MAIREIRLDNDSILYKKSKEVTSMTPRIKELIEDMFDTMYEADGVGLAAVQVGILKRIFITDVDDNPLVFINPEIIETREEQTGYEGCLSFPGLSGMVKRPRVAVVKAKDIDMNEFTMEFEDLAARAVLHEYDHLDGHVYTELVEGDLVDLTKNNEEDESEIS